MIVKANGYEKEIDVQAAGSEDVGEEEDFPEVKVLEEIGSFQEVMAWGHESQVDDDDAFVKGIEEWIKFSQVVSCPSHCGCGWRLLMKR